MSLADRIDGVLVRQAAQHADLVRSAMRRTVDVKALVARFLESHPQNISAADARSWVRVHASFNTTPVELVLREIYLTGWILGRDSASAHLARAVFKKAIDTSGLHDYLNFDWDNWSPGNDAPGLLTRPPGALQSLLAKRGVTVSGFSRTTYDRMGTLLADGIASGASGDELASMLESSLTELLGDSMRALTIANTEMARAMSVSAVDTYTTHGVEQIEWLGMDPCPQICETLDGQQVDVGGEFTDDDGDTYTEPPAHPNCRCTLLPVVEGM